VHANTNDSTIKKAVDNWYKEHIFETEYEQYISDTLFCNDRSISPYKPEDSYLNTGIGKDKTAYRWWYRPEGIFSKNNPTLKCKQQNDQFTSKSASFGNKALTYPIGLITADELFLAGGYDASNSGYYLYTGYNYWTMSPVGFNGHDPCVCYVYSEGYVGFSGSNVTFSRGVRSTLSLIAGSLKSGSGTWDDPYMVG